MKRAVGHVCDEQRALHSATHGARVHHDLVERDGHSVAVAEHGVADAIADENDVNARFVNDACHRVIVSGQTDETFIALLARAQGRRSHFLRTLRFEISHLFFSPNR